MRSLNEAKLIGHLGQDPELRYTSGGTAVANLRVATNETWQSDGEQKSKTEWHTVVAWEKLAEIINEHLQKGSRLYVDGRLETRQWEDRDGNDRYTTQIVADEVIFLGSEGNRSNGQSSANGADGQNFDQGPPKQAAGDSQEETFEPDDELPF